MLNVVLLGPQGSGKGTQAKLLAERYGLVHLEMGQLLRRDAHADTPEGRALNEVINVEGKLAPFNVAMSAFRRALADVPADHGVIFDGTPRRREEVTYWDEELPKLGRAFTHILVLRLSEAGTIERLSKRRVCERDGTPFILGVDLPDESAPCPRCGGRLIQRPDDRLEAIRTRLRTYAELTEPVIEAYRPRGIVHEMNGDQPIPDVFRDIERAIESERAKGKSEK